MGADGVGAEGSGEDATAVAGPGDAANDAHATGGNGVEVGGSGGNGGQASAAAHSTSDSEGLDAVADALGGNGGDALHAGGNGGAADATATVSSATGPGASVDLSAVGGNGGSSSSDFAGGGSGGAGGQASTSFTVGVPSSILLVVENAQGGRGGTTADQLATGDGGDATCTVDGTASSLELHLDLRARGGDSTAGMSRAGSGRSAAIVDNPAGLVDVSARAFGGLGSTGGDAYATADGHAHGLDTPAFAYAAADGGSSVAGPHEVKGGDAVALARAITDDGPAQASSTARGGDAVSNGALAGSATARSDASGSEGVTVESLAAAIGGTGGAAAGVGGVAADGGMATATAHGANPLGGSVTVGATAQGGAGGGSDGVASAGKGADTLFVDAATGETPGSLTLIQTAQGGQGGLAPPGIGYGGAGGSALSELANPGVAGTLALSSEAIGGGGGSGRAGGTALAGASGAAAQTASITAIARGGVGGDGPTGGAGGAAAIDRLEGTSPGVDGNVDLEAEATGGAGGLGLYGTGGAGGSAQATAPATFSSASNVLGESTSVTGGKGGDTLGGGAAGDGGSALSAIALDGSAAIVSGSGSAQGGDGGKVFGPASPFAGGRGGDARSDVVVTNRSTSVDTVVTQIYNVASGGKGGRGAPGTGGGGDAEVDSTAASLGPGGVDIEATAYAGIGAQGSTPASARAVSSGQAMQGGSVTVSATAYGGGFDGGQEMSGPSTALSEAVGAANSVVGAGASALGPLGWGEGGDRLALAHARGGSVAAGATAGVTGATLSFSIGANYALDAYALARTGGVAADPLPAQHLVTEATLHPLRSEVDAALQGNPSATSSLDEAAFFLGSLTATSPGCPGGGANCASSFNLQFDFKLTGAETLGLGLLGSEFHTEGGDFYTGDLIEFDFEGSDGLTVYYFSDPAEATAFFTDRVLPVAVNPDNYGIAHLHMHFALNSDDANDLASLRFILAPLAAPEPRVLALLVAATLAVLRPGWRNWQTRRP